MALEDALRTPTQTPSALWKRRCPDQPRGFQALSLRCSMALHNLIIHQVVLPTSCHISVSLFFTLIMSHIAGWKGWFFSHSLAWVCQHSQLWCDFGKLSWNDTTITHPTVLEDWCLRVHTDFHSCIWCSSFCPLRFLWAKISPSQLLLLFNFLT